MTSILTAKGIAAIDAARQAAENAEASCKATQDALANFQFPPAAASAPASSLLSYLTHDVLLVGGYAALAIVLIAMVVHLARAAPSPAV
jgi:hypothetical protein